MDELLKLSQDKQTVLDMDDHVCYVAQERDGKTIYVESAPVLDGRVCAELKVVPKKVCVNWNGSACVEWGGIDIEICVRWENN